MTYGLMMRGWASTAFRCFVYEIKLFDNFFLKILWRHYLFSTLSNTTCKKEVEMRLTLHRWWGDQAYKRQPQSQRKHGHHMPEGIPMRVERRPRNLHKTAFVLSFHTNISLHRISHPKTKQKKTHSSKNCPKHTPRGYKDKHLHLCCTKIEPYHKIIMLATTSASQSWRWSS